MSSRQPFETDGDAAAVGSVVAAKARKVAPQKAGAISSTIKLKQKQQQKQKKREEGTTSQNWDLSDRLLF